MGGPGLARSRSDEDCLLRCLALAPRCSALPMARIWRTDASTPACRKPAAAAVAKSNGRSIPRLRVLVARAGTGMTAIGSRPYARLPTSSAGAIRSPALRAASAKNRSRSLLPPSFHATTIEWLGPTSSAIAQTGRPGRPSTSSRGARDSDRSGASHHTAAHSSHHRTSRAPHPGHHTGTMSRAMSLTARVTARATARRDPCNSVSMLAAIGQG